LVQENGHLVLLALNSYWFIPTGVSPLGLVLNLTRRFDFREKRVLTEVFFDDLAILEKDCLIFVTNDCDRLNSFINNFADELILRLLFSLIVARDETVPFFLKHVIFLVDIFVGFLFFIFARSVFNLDALVVAVSIGGRVVLAFVELPVKEFEEFDHFSPLDFVLKLNPGDLLFLGKGVLVVVGHLYELDD
jgi:hypothetical protein